MKAVGKLYFSEIIRCWYDPEGTALYVYSGRYVRYDYISEMSWMGLKSDPTPERLASVVGYFAPKIVAGPPKGAVPLIIYPSAAVTMYTVNSTNVKAVGYDAENRTLYIQFTSRGEPIYSYENVPASMWEALQTADSKGSWVHWFLVINEGEFPYRRNPPVTVVYDGPAFNPGTKHPKGYMVDEDWR